MSYELISETKPKARKDHECIWCGERIDNGDRYVRVVYNFHGDFNSDAYHPECSDASKEYLTLNDTDEFMPGEYVRGSAENKWCKD